LEIQYEHEQISARTAGEAGSQRVRTFLDSLGNELSLDQKLLVFNVLEKKDCIHDLAQGTGITLFCSPQDLNLNMGVFGSMDHTNEELMKIIKSKVKTGNEKLVTEKIAQKT